MTKEQFQFLFKYEFTDKLIHLEKVRKMVLIQCSTGCRYGDISKFRPQNFVINSKNKIFLKFRPTKTSRFDKDAEQPLNKYAESLLKEVDYNTSCYSMQNQPYNRAIKDMFTFLSKLPECSKLHFKTNHTSHNGRDFFITQAVQSGVNFKSILTWVGHSSYAILDRYIKPDEDFHYKEMQKMSKQL